MREIARAIGRVGVDYVDQMVRGFGALGGSGFSGPHVHVTVDLARVRRNDLAVGLFCQSNSQARFAARSRPGNHDNGVAQSGAMAL